jgi:predicted Fe-S protein YdhL (DUF1289 family)
MSPPGRPKGEYRSAEREDNPMNNMRPAPDTQHVASPCTSVCTIDPVNGLCAGCYRTLDEIAGWIQLSDDAKCALIAALAARRARVGAMLQTPDAADGQR